MTTYALCKKVIENDAYDSKEDMLFKLDVFFLNNRINQQEYDELVGVLGSQ